MCVSIILWRDHHSFQIKRPCASRSLCTRVRDSNFMKWWVRGARDDLIMHTARRKQHFFFSGIFFIHERLRRPLSFIHNDDLLAARRSDAQCAAPRVEQGTKDARCVNAHAAKFRSIWALGIFPKQPTLSGFRQQLRGEKRRILSLSLAHMRCGRCFQLFLSKTHTARVKKRGTQQHITNIIKATKLLCGATKKEETGMFCSERACVCVRSSSEARWKPVWWKISVFVALYIGKVASSAGSLLIIIIRDCPERYLGGSAASGEEERRTRWCEINPDDFSKQNNYTPPWLPVGPMGSFEMHFYMENRKTPLTSLFFTLSYAGEREFKGRQKVAHVLFGLKLLQWIFLDITHAYTIVS